MKRLADLEDPDALAYVADAFGRPMAAVYMDDLGTWASALERTEAWLAHASAEARDDYARFDADRYAPVTARAWVSSAGCGAPALPHERGTEMTTPTPLPPPLDAELEALLRRMRLPHARRAGPEVLATARAQRWEPAEVLNVLLKEEVAGRERSSVASRQAAAGFPTGKTFEVWDPALSVVPAPTQAALRTLEWVDRHENLVEYAVDWPRIKKAPGARRRGSSSKTRAVSPSSPR